MRRNKCSNKLNKFGDWTLDLVCPWLTLLAQGPPKPLRALAWLNRKRHLAKDFKAPLASANAWLYFASVQIPI
jgi:hypothetical protein